MTRTPTKPASSPMVISRGPFAFGWSVPLSGYLWREDLAVSVPPRLDCMPYWPTCTEPTKWLVQASAKPGEPIPWDVAERRYPPLAEAGLHRRFARVKQTPEGVLAFANRYGVLGYGGAQLANPQGSEPVFLAYGEPLWLWLGEIETIRRLLDWLQVLCHVRECGRLPQGTPVRWGEILGEPHVSVTWEQAGQRRSCPVDPQGLYRDQWTRGETAGPLSHHLATTVNARLEGHLSWQLIPRADGDGFWHALFPDSLLAAMYLGLALELASEGKDFRQCAAPDCGRPFYPTGRQRFCSINCKDRTNQRKSRAQKGASHAQQAPRES